MKKKIDDENLYGSMRDYAEAGMKYELPVQFTDYSKIPFSDLPIAEQNKILNASADTKQTVEGNNANAILAKKQEDDFANSRKEIPATSNPTIESNETVDTSVADTASNYIEGLLNKIKRTSYSDDLERMIADYKNREAFSYNSNDDVLYQSYLRQAQRSGARAMEDTMGQASALSGGYASSYAQNVGNSAYNAYLQDADNKMIDFYNNAYDRYASEGNQMINNISMQKALEDEEYQKAYNMYGMLTNQNSSNGYETANPNIYKVASALAGMGDIEGLEAFLGRYPDLNIEDVYNYALDHPMGASEAKKYLKESEKALKKNDYYYKY